MKPYKIFPWGYRIYVTKMIHKPYSIESVRMRCHFQLYFDDSIEKEDEEKEFFVFVSIISLGCLVQN